MTDWKKAKYALVELKGVGTLIDLQWTDIVSYHETYEEALAHSTSRNKTRLIYELKSIAEVTHHIVDFEDKDDE